MADKTYRQQIVDAVMTRMAAITTANGYQTNIGSDVHDWRVNFQQDELPAVSVCDLETIAVNSDPRTDGLTTWALTVQICIYSEKDTDPSIIRMMIADVTNAIGTDDRWKVSGSNLAIGTEPKRDGFLIPDDSFEVIGGVVEFDILYFLPRFNAGIS